MVERTWPLPSESRRSRRVLYLGEGVAAGGVLALAVHVLLGLVEAVASLDWPLSAGTLALLALLGFALVRGIGLIAAGRGDRPARSPVERDWTETRRWGLVAAVALASGSPAIAVVVAHRDAGAVPGVAAAVATLFAGIAVYAYGFRRLGVRVP